MPYRTQVELIKSEFEGLSYIEYDLDISFVLCAVSSPSLMTQSTFNPLIRLQSTVTSFMLNCPNVKIEKKLPL